MEGSVAISTRFSPETLHVILKFSFHDAANCDNVTANAGVNEIVLNLAVNRLWHFARINVLYVVVNFLNSQSLEK